MSGAAFAYEPQTPWRPLSAVIAGGAIVLTSWVAAEAVGRGYDALAGIAQPGARPAGALEREVVLRFVFSFATLQLTMLALTLAAAQAWGGEIAKVCAWRAARGGVLDYLGGAAVVLLGAALWVGVLWWWFPAVLAAEARPLQERLTMAGGLAWVPVLVVGAPLAEELFFRGFLFSAIATSRLGAPGACVLTAAAWSGLHVGYSAHLHAAVFVLGLGLGLLLARTGSLKVPLLCHVAYNATVVAALLALELPP